MNVPEIGILQGRLTPSNGRGIQFFPAGPGEWEKEFESAKTAGLSTIELLVRDSGLRDHPLMTDDGRTHLKELSLKNEITIPSVHAYYSKESGYATDIWDVVRATASIGAQTVLISFFKERRLSTTYDESWDLAHSQLLDAADVCAQTGVKLGIEAEMPAEALLDFISKAETPEAFGVYYDLGNQFACGFPVAEEISILKNRIVGIHIKDRLLNTQPDVESPSVPLGKGSADFKLAFEALKKVEFERPLILQAARGVDGEETKLARENRAFVENIRNEVWKLQ